MLAIQPISSIKTYSVRPAFGHRYDDDLEDDRAFFEDKKAEIDEMRNDDKLPGGMKKGLKFVSIITDGIIAGISVACATIAGAKWSKSVYSKAAKTEFGKNVSKEFKSVKNFTGKELGNVKTFIKEGLHRFLDTAAGKKLVKIYDSFASTSFGKKTIEVAKNINKGIKNFAKKLNIFNSEESYDKASRKTAVVLGTGSGVASAYATAVKEKTENSEAEE